jgi:hypothetical protein
MPETCSVCDLRKRFPNKGIYWQGQWYCGERCRHGAKALHTIDELVGGLRDVFCDDANIMQKIRESLARTLEAL